ncbi:MAG: adenine-specific methyltransferase EcoRI family protein [Oscillospiraceae bacterium]|jgi:hypothetical protein
MAKNASLNRAAVAKEDEFYTQLTDIEKELRHYRDFFKGKTVLCNCDDPYESNFFKYFAINFNLLKLKKLIATCYSSSPVMGEQLSLFDIKPLQYVVEAAKPAYKIEITEVRDENGDGRIDLADVEYLLRNKKNILTLLAGDGDFRSPECVELLNQADIVVTNPPFSLFREYITQLVDSGKHFIIIGNQNAITYKEVFPMLRDNKVWLGYHCGDMEFTVPDYYQPRATRYREENGVKYRSMGNICWYTNVDIPKRHENLLLYRTYTSEDYLNYDNYEAININKVVDIPCDYYGVMGVPITFLDKYNPEQFEIIGLIAGNIKGLAGIKSKTGKDGPYINGKLKYGRILIRRKQVQTHED